MLELPRHVHKGGGVGQGGESKVVSTLDELDAAVADGWVVDPNAAPNVSDGYDAGHDAEPSTVDTPSQAPPDEPIPDVLDDPDGAPPEDAPDSTEVDDAFVHSDSAPPAKRKPGRPRKA